MTKEEIDKMEAGQELDKIIGETLFNWKPFWIFRDSGSLVMVETKAQALAWTSEIEGLKETMPPPYSTDVSAAFKVFNKLIEAYGYSAFESNEKDGGFSCYSNTKHGHAQTLPLAICRCALKSVL